MLNNLTKTPFEAWSAYDCPNPQRKKKMSKQCCPPGAENPVRGETQAQLNNKSS